MAFPALGIVTRLSTFAACGFSDVSEVFVLNNPGENGAQTPVLETRRCVVGHSWDAIPGTDKQKVCPTHASWWAGILPKELRPGELTIGEWTHAEDELVNERGYVARWQGVWTETVRRIAAAADSWDLVDLDRVDDYVRARRLSELHRLFAQDEPYNEKGRAHPGWKISREFASDARRLAVELGLEVPKEVKPSRMQTSADVEQGHNGVVDSQVGPDGRPL